jgi:hypothetical protein
MFHCEKFSRSPAIWVPPIQVLFIIPFELFPNPGKARGTKDRSEDNPRRQKVGSFSLIAISLPRLSHRMAEEVNWVHIHSAHSLCTFTWPKPPAPDFLNLPFSSSACLACYSTTSISKHHIRISLRHPSTTSIYRLTTTIITYSKH